MISDRDNRLTIRRSIAKTVCNLVDAVLIGDSLEIHNRDIQQMLEENKISMFALEYLEDKGLIQFDITRANDKGIYKVLKIDATVIDEYTENEEIELFI